MGQDNFLKVQDLIPHRPPFLWVDRILECNSDSIVTELKVKSDLELFQGHYPGHPIMPGVLLCEAIFQSGALLMATTAEPASQDTSEEPEIGPQTVPVLTRISNAKFKRPVLPGDRAEIHVQISEKLAEVVFFRGRLKVAGKLAVQVDFSCAMTTRV